MNEKVLTLQEYLKAILNKTYKVGSDDDSDRLFWFRGESSVDFKTPLIPSAYRVLAVSIPQKDDEFNSKHIKRIERNLNAVFSRKALPFISSKGIENNLWNRYFLMQHYGIYTRLLDWSENALIALLFAITENNQQDAKIWILSPFSLNDYTIRYLTNSDKSSRVIPPATVSDPPCRIRNIDGELCLNEITRRYLTMDFERSDPDSSNVYYPLAIYPSYLDERMSAQKTCFTIFGNKIRGLNAIPNMDEKIIDYVVIDGKSKANLMKELQLIGIDHSSAYPDLDGLGKSIMDLFKQYYSDNTEALYKFFEVMNKEV